LRKYGYGIILQDPVDGNWTLVRHVKRNWEVNVTGEASMDMQFLLIETDEKGFAFETKGNPVAGMTFENKTNYLKMTTTKLG